MGGGAAMRTAVKAAGFGINGGFRGFTSSPVAEPAVTGWKYSRSVPPIVSATSANEGGKSAILVSSSSQTEKIDEASVQKPSWEVDDWEFAGGEEDLFDSLLPTPRVVFGAVPTLDEAKEATSDLKDAIEKIYFSSSDTTGCNDSSKAVQGSTFSRLLSLEDSETKACVTSDRAAILPSVSKHVFQAFTLLNESPEAQNVVASLASDKNVWEAVMKNEKVMEFYQSNQIGALPDDVNVDMGYAEKHTEESNINILMELMNKIKMKVVEMISNISNLFQNVFGNFTQETSFTESKRSTTTETAIGASFMALAIAAIMVVLVKRG
eukprot:TRINITY_DN728_c0_g1_i1.p1 TRINITY_DN728_c0_g1~~TRINITY_DN728_c0_g1_i1.p1  ORF type:complete len:323 (+),score=68.70 TRINITY_DN728_c0_g1_i1:245-1213(+)